MEIRRLNMCKIIVAAVLILIFASASFAGEHSIKILRVWEEPAMENQEAQIHVKVDIDGYICWDNYPASKVKDKASLLALVKKNADKMLERAPKTVKLKLRPDLYDWDIDSEKLDYKMMKAILWKLIEQINVLRAKMGLPEITKKQIKVAIKQDLDSVKKLEAK